MTGTRPAARCGATSRFRASPVSAVSGAAPVYWSSVTIALRASIHDGVDAGGLNRARHDAAADELARRGDAVAGPRRGFAQDRERGQHRAQLVDLLLDLRRHRRPFGRRHQRVDRRQVPVPDLVHAARDRRALAARRVGVIRRSWSVTLDIADTTTTGGAPDRAA